ncbi:MAG: isoprenylcysteine carboxylmethyltransferase family protein [Clostridia bacterium]|nr:isoprenylcysteine carboxylmethyltransferase family protein [Clostridia bacterium]
MAAQKQGIQANVLGRAGKEKKIHKTEVIVKTSTLIWAALWLFLSIFERVFWPVTVPLIPKDSILRVAGLLIMTLGCAIFIMAMVFMKTSWRVGIDKKTSSELITSGLYKYSRNPAFVGFDLMFLGFSLMYFSVAVIIAVLINIIALHFLILEEERHLTALYGDVYRQYQKTTPRYLVWR